MTFHSFHQIQNKWNIPFLSDPSSDPYKSAYIASLAARRGLGIQNHPNISAVFKSMLSIPGMGLAREQGPLGLSQTSVHRRAKPPTAVQGEGRGPAYAADGRCQMPRALRARPLFYCIHRNLPSASASSVRPTVCCCDPSAALFGESMSRHNAEKIALWIEHGKNKQVMKGLAFMLFAHQKASELEVPCSLQGLRDSRGFFPLQ